MGTITGTEEFNMFCGVHIYNSVLDTVRNSFSDSMSDADLVGIIFYLRLENKNITKNEVVSKVTSRLHELLNRLKHSYNISDNDRSFLLCILGWKDYCLLMDNISNGIICEIHTLATEDINRVSYYVSIASE